jgi:hypothetical protein
MLGGYCRGQPRRSPKNRGACLKLQKTQNAKPTSGLTQNIHTTRSMPRWPPRPTEAAQQSAHSSEVRLARGPTPPSSRYTSLEDPRLPRMGSASLEVPSRAHLLPHACTGIQCSDTVEPRHYAPGNHALTLFRQLPRGSPSPPLWGTVRRGRCQLRDTVPPTLVRLTRRALEGGQSHPRSLFS